MRKKLVFAVLFLLSLVLIVAALYLSGVLNWGSQKLFNQKNPFSMLSKPQTAPMVVVDKEVRPDAFSNVPESFADRFNQVKCELPEGIKKTLDVSVMVPGIKEGATNEDDYWILSGNQPVVLDYFKIENNEYMVGGLQATDGTCFKLSFILTGSFGVEDKSGMFDETKVKLDGAYISADEFKTKFPVGSQVGVGILAKKPESLYLQEKMCSYKGERSEYYCSVQRATETYARTYVDTNNIDLLSKFPGEREPLYIIFSYSALK